MKLWHMFAIMGLISLCIAAFYLGLGYVAVHFLRKWW